MYVLAICVLVPLYTSVVKCLCPVALRVNISDGTMNENREIVFNDIVFARNQYIEVDDAIWGCPCAVKPCIRKCCPDHRELTKDANDRTQCVPTNLTMDIDVYDGTDPVKEQVDFFTIHGMRCSNGSTLIYSQTFYIQKNGFYFDDIHYPPDSYCIDYHNDIMIALICVEPLKRTNRTNYWTLMIDINVILSTICFAITAVIYWLILNENIILKKCIILFSSSMCVVFISLIVINVQANVSACRIFGFSFLTMTVFSFLWLPISCIELFYLVFIVPEHKQKKCRWYYYVGVSSAISILILTVSLFSGDTWVPDIPNTFIRHPSSCTYNVEYKRTFILFVPMILSFALSVIFIIMTTKWIRKRDNQEEIRNTYYWIQNRNNYKFMCRTYMVIVFASLLWCAHLFYYHDGTQLTLDVLEAALGIVTLAALVLNKYTRKEISSLYRKKPTVTAESLNMGAMGSPTTPDYESNPFFSNNHSNGSDQPNNR